MISITDLHIFNRLISNPFQVMHIFPSCALLLIVATAKRGNIKELGNKCRII